MKKLIVLMLALMPMVVFAQTRTEGSRDAASRSAADKEAAKREMDERAQNALAMKFTDVYVEFVLSDQGGKPSLRLIKDGEMLGRVSDKDFQRDLETLAQQSFSNVSDLMTYLGSKGYRFVSQYDVVLRGQSSTRFVFSKQIAMPPYVISGEKPESKPNPESNGQLQGRGGARK